MKTLYLIGKGGHSRSVEEVAKRNKLAEQVKILSHEEFEFLPRVFDTVGKSFLVAIGDIKQRDILFSKLLQRNLPICSVISSLSIVAHDSTIENGSVVMPSAVIRSGAVIGRNTIINTGAIVDHNSLVGESCNVSPGVVICGSCRIGNQVFLGAGATVVDSVKISDGIVIGAGAVVVKDIEVPGTYVGNPAVKIK